MARATLQLLQEQWRSYLTHLNNLSKSRVRGSNRDRRMMGGFSEPIVAQILKFGYIRLVQRSEHERHRLVLPGRLRRGKVEGE